jgi:hypothetical protein
MNIFIYSFNLHETYFPKLEAQYKRRPVLRPLLFALGKFSGAVAQLGERFLGKEEVAGSTPVSSIFSLSKSAKSG